VLDRLVAEHGKPKIIRVDTGPEFAGGLLKQWGYPAWSWALVSHAGRLAKSREAQAIIEREVVKRWGMRPITGIQPGDVSAAVRAIVDRSARYQAHNAYALPRRMFNWAIGRYEFGIEEPLLERLSPKDLIGELEARERALSDDELHAVWHAASADSEKMGFPYGPLVRFLILTGQRERDVADMTWRARSISTEARGPLPLKG
jgi:integrase